MGKDDDHIALCNHMSLGGYECINNIDAIENGG